MSISSGGGYRHIKKGLPVNGDRAEVVPLQPDVLLALASCLAVKSLSDGSAPQFVVQRGYVAQYLRKKLLEIIHRRGNHRRRVGMGPPPLTDASCRTGCFGL